MWSWRSDVILEEWCDLHLWSSSLSSFGWHSVASVYEIIVNGDVVTKDEAILLVEQLVCQRHRYRQAVAVSAASSTVGSKVITDDQCSLTLMGLKSMLFSIAVERRWTIRPSIVGSEVFDDALIHLFGREMRHWEAGRRVWGWRSRH